MSRVQIHMVYTLGIAFSPQRDRVVLMLKHKGPASIRRKYNGVGGKVEEGESPVQAQRREFREETGVDVPDERWVPIAVLQHPDSTIHVFRADLSLDEFFAVRSTEDEPIERIWMCEVLFLPLAPHLSWMIAIAAETRLEIPLAVTATG